MHVKVIQLQSRHVYFFIIDTIAAAKSGLWEPAKGKIPAFLINNKHLAAGMHLILTKYHTLNLKALLLDTGDRSFDFR